MRSYLEAVLIASAAVIVGLVVVVLLIAGVIWLMEWIAQRIK